MSDLIRAAGGVVWRVRDGRLEVALVHRARYDDWSLPKGKLAKGERELLGGVREVREETGARVAVSRRLGRVHYDVAGVPKRVGYWAMRYLDGEFAINDEVDAVAWAHSAELTERIAYDRDREILAEFFALPVPDSVVVLVRHAKAGKRSQWRGEDALRPLVGTGRQQADRLAELLPVFAPDRIVSADPMRCRQTVTPLAERLGRDVVIDPAFDDESYVRAPRDSAAALRALGQPGQATVVASQGSAIPGLVEDLLPTVRSAPTRKGAFWVLSFVDGAVCAA